MKIKLEQPLNSLDDTELITRVEDWVSSLCKSGGRTWSLSVPVNFNRDPDMLICELIRRYREVQQL